MRLAGIVVIASIAACSREPRESRGTPTALAGQGHHPRAEYLIREIAPTDTLWLDPSDDRQDSAFAASLAPPADSLGVSRFGAAEGEGADVLGGADAVAVVADGRVLLLDQKASMVRIVGRDGRLAGTFGQPGRGPGDFTSPMSLAVDTAGFVYVGDMGRRLQRFRADSGRFVFDTAFRLTASPIGVCLMDSVIVVHGTDTSDSSMVQVYDRSGHRLRGFGAAYRSPDPMKNFVFGTGMIACNARRHEVAYMPKGMIGEIRVYDVKGTLRRLAVLPDVKSNDVYDLPDGGYSVAENPAGHYALRSLVYLPAGLLVQMELSSRNAEPDSGRVVSLLLPDVPGSYVQRSTHLPQVRAIAHGALIYSRDDPTPSAFWRQSGVR